MQPIYQIDKIGKTLLVALKKCGKHKTFTEILDQSEIPYSQEEQAEAAIVLESLGLIESVSYRLPFEIRAELTFTGDAIATKLQKEKVKKDTLPLDAKMRAEGKSKPFQPSA